MIFLFLISFENVVITINIFKYLEYLEICPYTISDLDLKLHLERRCDLYNINNNSRYSYQYICSYNSAEEFKIKQLIKKQEKDINSYNVICVKVESLIKNNSIIDLFSKEYANSDKYYCSITNKPKDFNYAEHKDCNNTIKENLFILVNAIYYIQLYCFRIYFKYLENRTDSLAHFHQFNNPIDETKESENSIRINNFRKEKTINIIIENKEIFPIKSDIKKCITVNKSNIKNNIELDLINTSLDRKLVSSHSYSDT
jgi:hypothetical protein